MITLKDHKPEVSLNIYSFIIVKIILFSMTFILILILKTS